MIWLVPTIFFFSLFDRSVSSMTKRYSRANTSSIFSLNDRSLTSMSASSAAASFGRLTVFNTAASRSTPFRSSEFALRMRNTGAGSCPVLEDVKNRVTAAV